MTPPETRDSGRGAESDEAVGRAVRTTAAEGYWRLYGYCIVCGRDAGVPCWSASKKRQRTEAHFYRERAS